MLKKNSNRPILLVACFLFALCWLLPNKTDPWRGFHSELLAAVAIGLMAIVALFQKSCDFKIEGLGWTSLLVCSIPFLHFYVGLTYFSGVAWVSQAYVLGFLLALLIGGGWGRENHVQLGDCIFSPILVAGIVSVGLQAQQWLGVNQDASLDIWISSHINGRPAANMGQPNHLATLLLWSIIGAWWWAWRGFIGVKVLYCITIFLSFGVALTQSRTGFLGYGLLVALLLLWPPLYEIWSKRSSSRIYAGWMVTSILASSGVAKIISHRLMLVESPNLIERMANESRPIIWRIALDAILEKPWSGFGWNSAVSAQLLEAEKFQALRTTFFYSHNFLLDIFLWVGIPLGLAILIALIVWMWRVFYKIRSPFHALGFAMAMVLGVHSMLEYPLYYGYFLFPMGIVLGAINSGAIEAGVFYRRLDLPKKYLMLIFLLSATIGTVIVRDYLKVESTNLSYQLEIVGIRRVGLTDSPDLWILNQFKSDYAFRKESPRKDMSSEEIRRAEEVLKFNPSPRNFLSLAKVYQLNDRPKDAKKILGVMCKMVSEKQCELGRKEWQVYDLKQHQQ